MRRKEGVGAARIKSLAEAKTARGSTQRTLLNRPNNNQQERTDRQYYLRRLVEPVEQRESPLPTEERGERDRREDQRRLQAGAGERADNPVERKQQREGT